MSIFVIDEQKCHKDGICVAECPVRIIEMPDPEAPPRPIAGAEELCINCGHCAAVCPHGALSLASMPLDLMPAIRKELEITPEQAEQFLRSRRSIRAYKKEELDRATLQKLIELARFAPSGHNSQPLQWLVISGREQLKALGGVVVEWMRWVIKEQPAMAALMHLERTVGGWEAGMDVVLRNAPHVVIAHCEKENRFGPQAGTLALGYLELAAFSLGLGACWAGYFQAASLFFPPMQKALGLPAGHLPLGCMMVGKPKFHYHRLPLRNQPVITWR